MLHNAQRKIPETATRLTGRRRHGFEAAICAVLLTAALWAIAPGSVQAAADATAASAELSNQAFALLNSLNAPDADGNTNPDAKAMLGPIASFAGDAQTLSQTLSAGDTAGARHAAASLDADTASVDAALKTHHGALKADRWDALKQQLAAIEKSVPPSSASAPAPPAAAAAPPAVSVPTSGEAAGAGASALGEAAVAPPPAAAGGTAAADAPASPAPENGGPTIRIDSRRVVGNVTQVEGYLEGAALRSAGIYEGEQMVKPIDVGHVLGRQKVEFKLKLGNADIATNLRVIDQAGRMATASVYGEDSSALASSGREAGVMVDRGAGATEGTNTAEIPSASAPSSGLDTGGGLEESAPSAEEGLGSEDSGGGIGGSTGGLGIGGLGAGVGAPMGGVQINIESINAVNPISHLYQVVGQIVGAGVRRAGIYVDGRLVQRIPLGTGNVRNFSTNFIMNGATASIRAFGSGNRYVESSIAMPPAVASAPPIVVAPYGATPYNPFGINPYGMEPYGGPYGSPYGMPYGTPFGSSPSYGINIGPHGITTVPVSPYGAVPYGTVPYGAAPYAVNPYAPPINPYGNTAHPMGPDGR